jgi:hypothetical protein
MSISYSGLRNYGKATLPSVSGWGTNTNIIKDPPKSIYTRRINKVGETSSITSMIDESGSRACEAITVYARGINPMVSVSYGQGGGDAGRSGFATTNSGRTQASLPYKIINNGAFRPPVLPAQMTYPLSRLPRNTTSAFTKKNFPDYQKKMVCAQSAEKMTGVKNTQLKASVRPTATIQFETPLIKPFEVKYVIQNTIKTEGNSGCRTQDLTTQYVEKPTKEININPFHACANANHGSNITITHLDNNNMDTERYIQNTNNKTVSSGVYYDKTKFTDNNNRKTDKYIQDSHNKPVTSGIYYDKSTFSENNNMETNKYIQDTKNKTVTSGVYYDKTKFTDNNNMETDKYIQDSMNKTANSGIYYDKSTFSENNNMETDRYIQSTNHSNVKSQKSQNINVTCIEDIMDTGDIKIKNPINISYSTPLSGNTRENYIHTNLELERRVPHVQAETNKRRDIYIRNENQHVKTLERNRPIVQVQSNNGTISRQEDVQIERNYILRPSLKKGGYEGRGQKPMENRQVYSEVTLNSEKNEMNKRISREMHNRYTY